MRANHFNGDDTEVSLNPYYNGKYSMRGKNILN